ncbi:MAG: amidohydrolase [Cyanothece sp. SIO2G6]|nr:amidohydrolase [Cyanothece sp. SIO2G6]
MLSKIQDIATTLAPRLIEIRRHFHSYPELSGQEYKTAAYVAGVLSSSGLRVQELVGKTGVVGDLARHEVSHSESAEQHQPCLAIRVDMDALPIQEQTNLDFASKNIGLMHACGHDVHTTVGLGTAMVLAQLPNSLPGTTRFLFQPAEETAQGARWMIRDGVLDGVDAVLGLHTFPTILGGSVGIRYGALTAAADDIELVIQGEAGHGARPHEAVDAIWIAAQVVTTLQQAISRTQNPLRPVVLSFGQITGGRAPNVIADQVRLLGTVRSLHPETHRDLPQWIDTIVAQVCQSYGATYDLNYRRGIPSVQNDPELTQLMETAAREALGSDRIEILAEPSLGAEDFALYLDHVPGAMIRLGVGTTGRTNYPLHHPKYHVNEDALLTGVVTMAYSIYQYWQGVGKLGS